MTRPTIHLICNAHLDPVWQWRWEEGCSEAMSTFSNAVEILHQHDGLIFNHNEAVLYRWVQEYDPALFRQIQKLVKKGRWCISGGWYLQPDANLPGTESLIRHITEGRKFFKDYFDAQPKVAYNFDSFGHSGGLPQILTLAGYKMYIHMRPQQGELSLPSDLYRWRGIDGSEILTYRIAVGLYHTERDNIEQRLHEGTELALRINRDVPVFWGIGNHGGGATKEDLEKIVDFVAHNHRVRIKHSTPDSFYVSVRRNSKNIPLFEGDLQRAFTGCYTSLSRIKRGAIRSLGELTQAETLRTVSWWTRGQRYPSTELGNVWRDHLFNDFHDILPGSCTEPAERDALKLYGRVSESVRRLRLSAARAINAGKRRNLYVPLTVLNTNASCTGVPVEAECMVDLRPKWTGTWHLRLYSLNGDEIPCQEEQPESLLPFNGWRRKVSFFASLPPVGAQHYELRAVEGEKASPDIRPALLHELDPHKGLIRSLKADDGGECLAGYLLQPMVVVDDADSWGTDNWSYRIVAGQFEADPSKTTVLHSGPIRRITQSVLSYRSSKIVVRTITYPSWPVLEFHLRIHWNETRARLKLAIPTVFRNENILSEVPGGAIRRAADGQEYVHGRWCMLEGQINGRKTGFAVINSGQHGLDFQDGEIRLSVLRAAAYCHEQGLILGDTIERKYMDQGVHDVRLLVTAGSPETVRTSVAGLADWLSSPPIVYSHLPIGATVRGKARRHSAQEGLLSLRPSHIRMTACKQSWDGKAVVVRMHETVGIKTEAVLSFHYPPKSMKLFFNPFEIKTLRIERSGKWREVNFLTEQ